MDKKPCDAKNFRKKLQKSHSNVVLQKCTGAISRQTRCVAASVCDVLYATRRLQNPVRQISYDLAAGCRGIHGSALRLLRWMQDRPVKELGDKMHQRITNVRRKRIHNADLRPRTPAYRRIPKQTRFPKLHEKTPEGVRPIQTPLFPLWGIRRTTKKTTSPRYNIRYGIPGPVPVCNPKRASTLSKSNTRTTMAVWPFGDRRCDVPERRIRSAIHTKEDRRRSKPRSLHRPGDRDHS